MNQLVAAHVSAFARLVVDTEERAAHGRSSSAVSCLLTLRHCQPMTASELARILGIRQPTAHGLVENLIVEGLVERSPGRGRAMALRLTEGGLRHAAELQAARLNAVGNLLVGLEPIDLVQLDRLLSRILARATTDRATARTICRSCDHAICTGPDCPVGRAATAAEQGGAE